MRHLEFHLKDIAVPVSGPVNPVPCLEKNEKMFDKMINLAFTSIAGTSSRMGGKKEAKPEKVFIYFVHGVVVDFLKMFFSRIIRFLFVCLTISWFVFLFPSIL